MAPTKAQGGKANIGTSDNEERREVQRRPLKGNNPSLRACIGGIEVKIDNDWVLAVYLDDIRERVLRETQAQGAYDHAPECGKHPLDVTSFHPAHRTWGQERNHRPDILFELRRNDRSDPKYTVGFWMDNGRVVLGPEGFPIRNFRDIPALCSSRMEGFRLEAISRLDSRITIDDFRARMMRDSVVGTNALSMRKTRFRNRARCLAWDRRLGSDHYETKLLGDMTEEMLASNSTRGLRDLWLDELKELLAQTMGTVPRRGRGRAVLDSVRAERISKEKRKVAERAREMGMKGDDEDDEGLFKEGTTRNLAAKSSKRKKTAEEDDMPELPRGNKKLRTTGGPEVLQYTQIPDRQGRRIARPQMTGPTRSGLWIAQSPGRTVNAGPQDEWAAEHDAYPRTNVINGPESLAQMTAIPTTENERALIDTALTVTRDHYLFLTGAQAPETNRFGSYLSRYGELQLRLDWATIPAGTSRRLAGLWRWAPGLVEWNVFTELDSQDQGTLELILGIEQQLRNGCAPGQASQDEANALPAPDTGNVGFLNEDYIGAFIVADDFAGGGAANAELMEQAQDTSMGSEEPLTRFATLEEFAASIDPRIVSPLTEDEGTVGVPANPSNTSHSAANDEATAPDATAVDDPTACSVDAGATSSPDDSQEPTPAANGDIFNEMMRGNSVQATEAPAVLKSQDDSAHEPFDMSSITGPGGFLDDRYELSYQADKWELMRFLS